MKLKELLRCFPASEYLRIFNIEKIKRPCAFGYPSDEWIKQYENETVCGIRALWHGEIDIIIRTKKPEA